MSEVPERGSPETMVIVFSLAFVLDVSLRLVFMTYLEEYRPFLEY